MIRHILPEATGLLQFVQKQMGSLINTQEADPRVAIDVDGFACLLSSRIHDFLSAFTPSPGAATGRPASVEACDSVCVRKSREWEEDRE